ncbi:esterase-like activity of phytase family protein [Amaricoccus solimangrovi]|uniref:Alkaline phosphatase n=1 Tax=Amaricoccus solimangrovi TaxID=2589815 RepID=A0A501WZJ5_9RHOB|nr:esterase-like activity of phytase family protein [Amaricoccus solimangrovi]TPE53187.1 alkaline phosphatase [Amaricoccus solimangrovi]
MPITRPPAACLVSLAALTLATPALAEPFFNRIASFPVAENLPEGTDPATPTSAEIVTASGDGMVVIYSDSPNEEIGFVDIADPAAPKGLGSLAMGGEPTSVATRGGTVFVGVNTSESHANPSGRLATVDIATRAETGSCELGGQPDSVAVAPDGSFVAVAVENERDEDLNDGALPQMPAGHVAIAPLREGAVDCAGLIRAAVTGLAEIAPEDPEPEFVDVNAAGEIAVTLQENNHVVILDRTGEVLAHFSAGTVDLDGVDLSDDGRLSFTESAKGVRREPDAVQWVSADRLAIANEGDWQGGSRGFSVLNRDGSLAYESGPALERAIVEIGQYPDKRSDAKGVEPEGLEFARFGEEDYLFVLTERASVVGVYGMKDGQPDLRQLLPSGVSPEGAVAIPSRRLLVTANEADLVEDGAARSHVMLYALQDVAAPDYPTITSAGAPELIGWGALSGLAADPETPGKLYAVSDSFYGGEPRIFEIDATATPARITRAIDVTRDGAPARKLDLEGIAPDGEGGFWLANEGNRDKLIPHALIHVDAEGAVAEEIAFPEELAGAETRFGAEGVTMVDGKLWVAVQREWGDDPKGAAKLLAYDPEAEIWGAVRYPLDPAPEGGWIGLSEISAHGDHVYLIERDNRIGTAAKVKRITRVAISELEPAPLGGELPVVTKEMVRDLLPDLAAPKGYVVDKVEGFAIDASGAAYAVTDNDGVDDSSGETDFLRLGPAEAM